MKFFNGKRPHGFVFKIFKQAIKAKLYFLWGETKTVVPLGLLVQKKYIAVIVLQYYKGNLKQKARKDFV